MSRAFVRYLCGVLSLCSVLFSAPAAISQTASLSTNSMNFGSQAVGVTSTPQVLTVTNTGSATLTFSSILLTGPNKADWAPLGGNCLKVAPTTSCTIPVKFTPQGAGSRSATIQFTDNDPTSPQLVSLSGVGVSATADYSSASLNFGSTPVGNGSPLPLTLTNNGNVTLTVTNISTTGDYNQVSNCSVLVPAAVCTITVTFSPTATWSRMGLLTVQDNAGVQTIPLSGMGSSGGAPSLSPTGLLVYAGQPVGTTSLAKTVTLTNNGTGAASFQSINVSGDFAQTNNCPSQLQVGASCTLSITFHPTWAAYRQGEVVLTYLDPPMVLLVPVAGQGKVVSTTVAVTPRQFSLTSAQTVQFSATINGSPTTNVTWLVDGVSGGNSTTGTVVGGLYIPPTSTGSHTVTAVSIALPTQSASSSVSVTAYSGTFTYHNDAGRTGQNLNESVLTTANVNSAQFGKLFSYALDGFVYAEPLYVSNVSIPNQGTHNVIYAATEHDSVYALDADTKQVLWQMSFINPAQSINTVPGSDVTGLDIVPEIGITGTPVIDPANGTLYVVALTKELVAGSYQYFQRLHALDITTGTERPTAPVIIQARTPGIGAGHDGQNQISFNALTHNQRPALLLLNGVVYVAWGSHADGFPFHGWVLGYDENSLQPVSSFITSPNSSESGIWQGGAGPAADANGSIYFSTGNGTFNAASGGLEYGDSILRLNPSSGLSTVADYFTPFNQAFLSANNGDLASGGVLVLPDQAGPYPHLLLGGGKGSTLYLINRDNMGGFSSTEDQVVQELVGVLKTGVFGQQTVNEPGVRGVPGYWNSCVYVGAVTDQAKMFPVLNGLLSTFPFARTSGTYYYPGVIPSISSNGTRQGIVWILENGGYYKSRPAVLHAYDAGNLGFELYNTKINSPRDQSGPAVKFTVPTVANGKVYVPAQYELDVYGLLP